jgi:diguanylate cyclase (GGDEF)-like protein
MQGFRRLAWAERAWDRLSHLGIEGHDRVVARYIMGTNHFVMLAIGVSIAWTVGFAVAFAPDEWWPAASHAGLIAVWIGCLVLNARGHFLTAALIAIIAPLAQYLWLAWQFSASAGFQLAMLSVGGVAFAVLPPRVVWARVGYPVLAFAAAVWSFYGEPFHQPELAVTSTDIEGVLFGNILAAALLAVLLAAFSDHYLLRERRLAEALVDQAEYAAKTDALTGVLNRRGLAPYLAAAVREGDYALALADLDRFKRINDRLGHGTGDVVLANVARRLSVAIGDEGIVSRWGGEEFLILLPGVSATHATRIMERARAAVDRDFGSDGVMEHVTLSAGVVHVPQGTSKEDALRIADRLLYEAKDAGRNCVLATAVVGMRHTWPD